MGKSTKMNKANFVNRSEEQVWASSDVRGWENETEQTHPLKIFQSLG